MIVTVPSVGERVCSFNFLYNLFCSDEDGRMEKAQQLLSRLSTDAVSVLTAYDKSAYHQQ